MWQLAQRLHCNSCSGCISFYNVNLERTLKMTPRMYVLINLCVRFKTLNLDDAKKYKHITSSFRDQVTDTIISREYFVDKSTIH